jgi:hypothetical protein
MLLSANMFPPRLSPVHGSETTENFVLDEAITPLRVR